jgi:hypothetical protein
VSTHVMVVGDTLPDFVVQLYGSDGQPADLTNADGLRFVMAPADDPDTPKVDDDTHTTIVTPGSGVVSYNFQAQDTDVENTFLVQWKAHYPGGAVQTYPARGWDVVVFRRSL